MKVAEPVEVEKTSRVLGTPAKAVVALVSFALVYGADQWVKYLVETTMVLGQKITVIEGLLWWHYILNPGAAFSMGANSTWIFTIFSTIAAVVGFGALLRAKSLWWILTLGVFLAGVLGNLTDRLFREPGFGIGHVVDYIALPHFAVFNIADMGICCSIAAMVILMLRGLKLDGTFEIVEKKGAK